MKGAPSCKLSAARRVRELVQNNSTLELFLQALTQLYPLDKMTPGIQLAFLPEGKFYASVARYDVAGAASPQNPGAKQVLVSAKADTLLEAINALAENWHSQTRQAIAFAKASGRLIEMMSDSTHKTGVTIRRHGKLVRRG